MRKRVFVPGIDDPAPSGRERSPTPRRSRDSRTPPTERPTFYILDAYSLIFQVFHAIPEMTGPAGQPTQAVFGIFRDLLNLLRDRKPDYLAAAFDGAGPVFRSEIFAEYKANRAEMPDDLVAQIPVIRRVFEGFRVPVLIVARDGGRRHHRHPRPPRRGARAGRLHRHRRQGRPPADQRPRPDPQPAQATR